MILGVLVALLLNRLGKVLRTFVSVGLLLAWAMPPLSATIVWGWIFDTQYGVLNYILTNWFGLDFEGHSWLIDPLSFFFVAAIIIVWGAVPFVAFTRLRGAHAGSGRGARGGAARRRRRRQALLPGRRAVHQPILMIVTILQVIWDLRVFTQIYALQSIGGLAEQTNTLGVYIYRVSLGSGDFGIGGAISVILVLLLVAVSIFYVRQSVKEDDAVTTAPRRHRPRPHRARRRHATRRARLGPLGSVLTRIAAVIVFVALGLPRLLDGQHLVPANAQIRGSELHFWPENFTLENYAAVIVGDTRAPFLPALGNSLAVTLLTVVVSLIFAFLAALAVTRFRFRSRAGFIIAILVRPDDPGRGDDHLDLPPRRRLAPAQQHHRPLGRVHRDGAAVHDLDAARFRQRRARRPRRGRHDRRAEPRRRVLAHHVPAARARPRRDGHLRIHPGVERVHLRARAESRAPRR